MKLNAGFIVPDLSAAKQFYCQLFGLEVVFENEFYLLLKEPDSGAELSFLLPNHPSQHEVFQTAYAGSGGYITIEVADADQWRDKLMAKQAPFLFDIRDEPWGDRHFAVADPNGLAVDVVRYQAPE